MQSSPLLDLPCPSGARKPLQGGKLPAQADYPLGLHCVYCGSFRTPLTKKILSRSRSHHPLRVGGKHTEPGRSMRHSLRHSPEVRKCPATSTCLQPFNSASCKLAGANTTLESQLPGWRESSGPHRRATRGERIGSRVGLIVGPRVAKMSEASVS